MDDWDADDSIEGCDRHAWCGSCSHSAECVEVVPFHEGMWHPHDAVEAVCGLPSLCSHYRSNSAVRAAALRAAELRAAAAPAPMAIDRAKTSATSHASFMATTMGDGDDSGVPHLLLGGAAALGGAGVGLAGVLVAVARVYRRSSYAAVVDGRQLADVRADSM